MRVAIHPTRPIPITVGQWQKDFGAPPLTLGALARPRARCPRCYVRVEAVAMAAIRREPHFAHPRGAACDAIDLAALPYDELQPGARAPQAGRQLRADFARNWRSHYGVLRNLVTALAVGEFIKVVKRADERRIWDYVDLPEHLLPYVLVLLADFTPDTAFRPHQLYAGFRPRTRWERFWVPERTRRISDLWIRVPPIEYIVRGDFLVPNDPNALPAVDDYEVQTFIFDTQFLERPAPSLSDFIVSSVRHELGFP